MNFCHVFQFQPTVNTLAGLERCVASKVLSRTVQPSTTTPQFKQPFLSASFATKSVHPATINRQQYASTPPPLPSSSSSSSSSFAVCRRSLFVVRRSSSSLFCHPNTCTCSTTSLARSHRTLSMDSLSVIFYVLVRVGSMYFAYC